MFPKLAWADGGRSTLWTHQCLNRLQMSPLCKTDGYWRQKSPNSFLTGTKHCADIEPRGVPHVYSCLQDHCSPSSAPWLCWQQWGTEWVHHGGEEHLTIWAWSVSLPHLLLVSLVELPWEGGKWMVFMEQELIMSHSYEGLGGSKDLNI